MIDIDNISFQYSKKKKLFRGLTQKFEPGKIYGLLGKNGTGKSTLLKLINGLIFPKEGEIKVDQYVSRHRHPDMLEKIFFLSENYQLPALTMGQFIKAYSPFYKDYSQDQFEKHIETFEVPTDNRLDKLSMGQKKKFIISFGIATNANYLLMDEPTNGLDIPSKSQFRKVIASGMREDQILVISTHQVRDLGNMIESVIVIDDGQIILSQDIFDIGNKLVFQKSLHENNDESALYSEFLGGAYIHIYPNHNNEPSDVELEILFNAIISDKDLITQNLS